MAGQIDQLVKRVHACTPRFATNITTDSFNAIIDSTGARTTVANTDQVLLWKFLNDAGTAIFMLEEGAEPLTVKITWVIVREDGDWKIASHHVSSKTPLIEQ